MGSILSQGHMSPVTYSSLEQDEPTPCLCHGEGPRASACPQSPVLGEHGGPALLRMGLLQGRNAQWVPEWRSAPLI